MTNYSGIQNPSWHFQNTIEEHAPATVVVDVLTPLASNSGCRNGWLVTSRSGKRALYANGEKIYRLELHASVALPFTASGLLAERGTSAHSGLPVLSTGCQSPCPKSGTLVLALAVMS